MEKLNVCLMNDSFPPMIDGVANAVINYANIITEELGSATVVTPNYPDVVDDYPFPVVRYKSMNITEKFCGYRAGYPFSSSKLDELSNSNFDIIHSHCPFASTVMARALREKTGAPIVLTYHTKFDIDIKRVITNPLMADAAVKFVVSNIEACDEVWTVSQGAKDNLRSLGYSGECIVMENGVDFPRGRANADDVAALRASYNLREGVPVFLFVGRMLWYKGIRLILDSLRILKNKGIEFRMIFVGDGADRSEIEAYTEEIGLMGDCIFTGAIYDREDLRVYYTAGDLFLFPSLYDTNGIVVREAAACGVASLLIEGSCAAEGITDKHTGILTTDNAQAIAAELEFAASHLEEVRQLGENAMNEVYISWEDSVKNAYKRYNVILENLREMKTQRVERFVQEEFFSAIDNITNSIQQIRSLRDMPRNRTLRAHHFSHRRAEKKKKSDNE